MITVIGRRLIQMVPSIVGVSILVFVLLIKMTDPVSAILGADARLEERVKLRQQLHLDDPLPVQYAIWAGRLLKGDLGVGYVTKRPVLGDIQARLPATLELAVCVMFIATFTAVIVAVIAARKPGGKFDGAARTVVFVFLAMPSFWLGIELIILFSRKLGWFPPSGRGAHSLYEHMSHLVLPTLTLGVGTGAALCRILRASLLEVLQSDYIRTARAKGLDDKTVLIRHALRNALIPFITLSGLTMAALLEGSVIVETVFAWPGVGSMMVDAIRGGDTPVAMAGILLISALYLVVNLLVDMAYVVVDPRIRLDGGAGR